MRRLRIAFFAVICCLAMTISALADYDSSVVRQVQEALNAAGYDCGAADGIAGKRTAGAVSDYQQDHGLTVDGQINDELLISLGLKETGEEGGVLGTVIGKTYRNEYFGFEFQGNDDWYFFSDEEIAQIMGIVSSIVSEADFESELEETGSVTDFAAVRSSGSGDNINITIEDNDILYGSLFSLDVLMLLMQSQLEESLTSVGYSDLNVKKTDVEFAGEIHPSILIEGSYLGRKIYEQLLMLENENYLATITITTQGENTIDQILPMFHSTGTAGSAQTDSSQAADAGTDTQTDTSQETGSDTGAQIDISQLTGDSVIDWKDKNLENAVKAALGIFGRDLTYDDVKDVTELNLNGKKISDISALAVMTNLVKLDLGLNNITDISALAGMTKLTNLTLYYNQISDVSALAGLTELQFLYLSDNKISDISPLAGLSNLMLLDISRNTVSDISPLSGMSKLISLILIGNPVTDTSPVDALVANGMVLSQ